MLTDTQREQIRAQRQKELDAERDEMRLASERDEAIRARAYQLLEADHNNPLREGPILAFVDYLEMATKQIDGEALATTAKAAGASASNVIHLPATNE